MEIHNTDRSVPSMSMFSRKRTVTVVSTKLFLRAKKKKSTHLLAMLAQAKTLPKNLQQEQGISDNGRAT